MESDRVDDTWDSGRSSEMNILDLTRDCRAYILTFLDNITFGVTQCTAKGFNVASVPEILLRKTRDYSLCSCSQLPSGPYYHAAHNGWIDLANFLRKNEVPFWGTYDCMAGAHRHRQFPMIEWLIEQGYKPSYCAFHVAVSAGDIPFFERLLKLYPNTPDIYDRIMECALEGGSIPMVEHLLGKGIPIPMNGHSIIGACRSGNLAMVEFVEAHWGMTCREVLQKWRDQERERIVHSNLPAKKKNKTLRNWPTDMYDHAIPRDAIHGGSLPILKKLCLQGFVDRDPGKYHGSFFEIALYERQIEILDWLKDQNWYPPVISYPENLSWSDLHKWTTKEGQPVLEWIQRNGIVVRVNGKVVPATEAFNIAERRIIDAINNADRRDT